jgi:hypothetical protein
LEGFYDGTRHCEPARTGLSGPITACPEKKDVDEIGPMVNSHLSACRPENYGRKICCA